MIERIQIKNYKCYGDPGVDFRLKRINFVFGDNSAGKSTFLQLLRKALNGDVNKVDSDFSAVVFKSETSRQIKMRVSFSRCPEGGLSPIYEYSKSKDSKGVFEYIGWTTQSENRVVSVGKDSNNDRICKEWAKEHWPHVVHSEAARPSRLLDSEGVNSSLDESVLLGSEAVRYVDRFFDVLNLPYSCKDRATLRDRIFGVDVKRRNVGAGIDGLYETALKLFEWRKEKNGILALEEPESHVNERQISSFMNFLVSEAMEGDSSQLIVECHSELMALKLKNLLRNGNISPNELAVFFVQKMEEGSALEEITMDEKGNFRSRWPNGGFFRMRTQIIDEFFKLR